MASASFFSGPGNEGITRLPISVIKMNGITQSRENISNDTIADYTEARKNGAEFPPPVVYYDGVHHWLADGTHRTISAIKAGLQELDCKVRMGGQRDAVLYGFGANTEHGLRRTNADKLRAVMRMLNDDEWGTWTDQRIAQYCKVSPHMVRSNRIHSTNPSAHRELREDVNGRLVDTSKIGHRKPKARPEAAKTIPMKAEEPAQRTSINPIQEFARSLKVANIDFKQNVKTDFGLVMFETADAIYQITPMLTAASFMAAFTTILYQRKNHAPAKKAVIVGRIMDDARPWVAQARHWKVEVQNA
jgi:hypothetical protein